ncbi:MAG: hypothetical protein ACTHMY_02180 [Solirubrobacteraceae bacterium]
MALTSATTSSGTTASSSVRPDRRALVVLGVLVGLILIFAIVHAATTGGVELKNVSVAGQVGDLLSFAVLCALLSSATVELVKRLTHVRGRLQVDLVDDWVRRRAETTDVDPQVALEQLASGMRGEPFSAPSSKQSDSAPTPPPPSIATGAVRLFDLPPDLLVARMAAAADAAVIEPQHAGELLRLLGHRSDPGTATASGASDEASGDVLAGDESKGRARERAQLADAQRVQSTLDLLQVELAARWRRVVQLAAVLVAGLYGIGLAYAGGLTGTGSARYILAGVALGGPGAWVVRDVAALLERLRG